MRSFTNKFTLGRHALDLGSSQHQRSPTPPKRSPSSRPTTPDGWSPTQPRNSSPGSSDGESSEAKDEDIAFSDAESEDKVAAVLEESRSEAETPEESQLLDPEDSYQAEPQPSLVALSHESYMSTPPLAQKPPELTTSSVDPSSSNPNLPKDGSSSGNSSLPSQSLSHEQSQSSKSSTSPLQRRVFRSPHQPLPATNSASPVHGNILVPNSDISMSQSQSQSQSWSQELAQGPFPQEPADAKEDNHARVVHPLAQQVQSSSVSSRGQSKAGSPVDEAEGPSREPIKHHKPEALARKVVSAEVNPEARPQFPKKASKLAKEDGSMLFGPSKLTRLRASLAVPPPKAVPVRPLLMESLPLLPSPPKDALQTTSSILRFVGMSSVASSSRPNRRSLPSLVDASKLLFRQPSVSSGMDVFSKIKSPQAKPSLAKRAQPAAQPRARDDDDLVEEVSEDDDEPSTLSRAGRIVRSSRSSTARSSLASAQARVSTTGRPSNPTPGSSRTKQNGTRHSMAATPDHDPHTWREPAFLRNPASKASTSSVSRTSTASSITTAAPVPHFTFGRKGAAAATPSRTESRDSVFHQGVKRMKLEESTEDESDGAARPAKVARTEKTASVHATSSSRPSARHTEGGTSTTTATPRLLARPDGTRTTVTNARRPGTRPETMEVAFAHPPDHPSTITLDRLQEMILKTGRYRHRNHQD